MNPAEEALYAHLTDPDSLDVIIREGFTTEATLEVIPSELGRTLVTWCIDYYFQNDRKVAPTKEAIMYTWGSQLEPLDISINDEYEGDSVQWAIDQLRADYVDYRAGEFAKSLASEIRQTDPPKRADKFQELSQRMHAIGQSIISRKNEMEGVEGLEDALKRYRERLEHDHKYEGITFGLPEIDDHTLGIHPGELGIFCGTSGGGKSWMAGLVTLEEFKRGRKPILFTLENDVEMTYDRLACLFCRIDYGDWQRSEVEDGDMKRVEAFLDLMKESPIRPIICQPDETEATGLSMVRRAIIEDCDSILIDQLTHIEPIAGSKARQRNEVVAEIVKDLYKQIKRGERKIPCLLFHQISRKGRENARKTGHYQMEDLGEATQVENAADLIVAIYQAPDDVIAEWAQLQMLKGRRVPLKDWQVEWRPHVGDVRVRKEMDADE